MSERTPHIPDTELERLLSETGSLLAYPRTPDFAAAFEPPPTAVANGLRPSNDGEVWRPPTRTLGIHPAPAASMDDRPRSRKHQALRLAAAAAAFAIIGLTLILLFRELDDGEQAGGEVPTTEPLVIAVSTEGTLTALDPSTGEVRYTINGDNQPDAIFSPDGTRLYVAGLSLSAHDAATGDEIWRVPYRFRVGTISNVGPSTLAISPDGTRLYIYSYDMDRSTGPTAASVPFFIQTYDTATGERLGESEHFAGSTCAARLHPSPDGKKLYAPCEGGGRHSVFDLSDGSLLDQQGGAAGAASAQQGDELHVVGATGRVWVIEMNRTTKREPVALNIVGQVTRGLAALSPDGGRLYVGVSDTVDDFAADAVLIFDTQTWQQVGRLAAEIPITTRELTVDSEGVIFTASTTYGDTSVAPTHSTVWRFDPNASTVEAIAEFPEQEIAHVLTASVPATPEIETDATSRPSAIEPLLIAVSSEGPVTAIEPDTGAPRYTINGGYQPDAVLSPDGTRLYVAGDDLSAHNAVTGAEIWRVEYQYRLHWTIDTSAPSTLAISPDGSRLYIASYDQERGTSPDANTIPHFIQTFDTANGDNLGESEAIRGGCTVPIHPAPDGQRLHAPCDGNYSVYDLPAGTLQPPPEGRAIVSASAQHDNELYLISSAGIVQVVDMSAVEIVRETSLDIDGQVSPQLAVLAPDGTRLHLGISTSGQRFVADQVLTFDTVTWQQIAQASLEEPLSNRDLVVDADGAVYGASTALVENSSLPVSSTIWRMGSETGVVEEVANLAAQEVAHILVGYVPVAEIEPEAAFTPNPELTGPVIGTALAELPADLRACRPSEIQTGPAGAPVFGRTLGGDGEITLVRVEDGQPARYHGIKLNEPTVVRILAGANPYPEDAQVTIRMTHAASNSALQIYPDHSLYLVDVPEYERRIWETELTFSHLGCWELLFISDQFAGVLWVYVQEELPDIAVTVYPTTTPAPTADPNAAEPTNQTPEGTPTEAPTATALPPTATVDTGAAAIEAALAALPAESKGCQATPGNPGDFGWEVAGVTLIGEGELWLNMVGGDVDYVLPPVQAGRSITTYWNIGGPNADSERFVTLSATELGTGTQVEADSRQPAGTSPFREGTVWRAIYTFPHAGCWQVVAQRPDYVGVLWISVEGAP